MSELLTIKINPRIYCQSLVLTFDLKLSLLLLLRIDISPYI